MCTINISAGQTGLLHSFILLLTVKTFPSKVQTWEFHRLKRWNYIGSDIRYGKMISCVVFDNSLQGQPNHKWSNFWELIPKQMPVILSPFNSVDVWLKQLVFWSLIPFKNSLVFESQRMAKGCLTVFSDISQKLPAP